MSLQIIRPNGEIYAFDATPQYQQGRDVQVTSYPVERGANPTDNAQAQSLEWQATGVITQGSGNVRPDTMVLILDEIALNAELLTVVHPRVASYQNIVLAGYSFALDTYQQMTFTLRFREIVTVEAQTVTIPPQQPTPPAADTASQQDAGKVGTPEANEAQAEAGLQSTLAWVGSLFEPAQGAGRTSSPDN